MTFTPFATVLTPAEIVAFTERMALPTLERLRHLRSEGQIISGGTFLGGAGFIFIARVGAPIELEELLGTLPLWPRAQTRVVPLGTFETRAASVRERLRLARVASEKSVEPVSQN